MEQSKENKQISPFGLALNKTGNYLSKPQNAILLVLGVVLSVLVIYPLITILIDSFLLHVGNEVELYFSYYEVLKKAGSGSIIGYLDLFGGQNTYIRFWEPFLNTMYLSVLSCCFALLFGGSVAYLITRTNLKFKKWISAVFIFPYIMPQWTLAVVWKDLFWNKAVNGTADGLIAATMGLNAPLWFTEGLLPTALVLGLHYAPFAYILFGGIFRNMDASLEEAATILNTPRWKIFAKITLPLVKPAVLSTILLVFSSAMGSYPVPHYLKYDTLATQYVSIRSDYQAQSSIIAIVMALIGIIILGINLKGTSGRKQYTTVSGKSSQASVINIGKVGKWLVGALLIITTTITSIFPIALFALQTFLKNPGDYSAFTTIWWTSNDPSDPSLFGQYGMLHNNMIWKAFGSTVFVAAICALLAGTIGMLVGYCVAKNRKSKWASYVNSIAFLPYLLPSLAVGAAFFVFSGKVGLYGTYTILIIVGTIKYIPFASRSSLNAMLQLSGEIEEAAVIQNIPWWKRMLRIVIPIQKQPILSGYLLPFITGMRELTLFMLLVPQTMLITTILDYFDEMGLAAFSSGINLILVVFILLCNALINKLTGASLDKGIGG